MKKLLVLALLLSTFAHARNDDWSYALNKNQYTPPSKIFKQEDLGKMGRDLATGAFKGDFVKQPNFHNLLGSFLVNITPASPLAIGRDFIANISKATKSDFKTNKATLAFSAAAFVPVVKDLKKVAQSYKLGQEAAQMTKIAKLSMGGLKTGPYVMKTIPALTPVVKASFDGPIAIKVFERGEIIFRSPTKYEVTKSPGRFFGMVAVDSRKGMDRFYNNVKYGNTNEMVRRYEVVKPFSAPFGKVKGGIGYQLYVPDHIMDVSEVLKWKGTISLKNTRI